LLTPGVALVGLVDPAAFCPLWAFSILCWISSWGVLGQREGIYFPLLAERIASLSGLELQTHAPLYSSWYFLRNTINCFPGSRSSRVIAELHFNFH
jgi:hypothetical protein